MPGASLPVPGFGASDCRCQTHLMRFGRLPALRKFKQTLKNFDPVLAPPLVEVTSTAPHPWKPTSWFMVPAGWRPSTT
jgi:hypothetical protein